MIAATPHAPLNAKAYLDALKAFIYVIEMTRFYDPTTLIGLTKEQLNDRFAVESAASEEGTKASDLFLVNTWGRRVDRLTYRPGAGRLVDEGGRSALNRYQPSALRPSKGSVDKWLALGRLLFPDPAVLDHVLNWCALLVQQLGVKVNHALLITSSTASERFGGRSSRRRVSGVRRGAAIVRRHARHRRQVGRRFRDRGDGQVRGSP